MGVSAIPIILFGVLFVFIPESPHYLCKKNEKEKLMECLKLISKINKKEIPNAEIVLEEDFQIDQQNNFENSKKSFFQKMKDFKIFQLFRRDLIFVTILSLLLWFICVFAYYGIGKKKKKDFFTFFFFLPFFSQK